MKKLEMIKEKVFEIGKDLELARRLFPDLETVESFRYGYSVYIENDRIRPVFGSISDNLRENVGVGFKDDFRAYLAKHQPAGFLELLFLLDVYFQSRQKFGYPVDWDQYQFQKLEVVDEILAGSKGILLWHYQLEQLFGCFYLNPDKALEARKAVNAKKAEVFDLAEKLKFEPGTSLNDIIWDRMVFSVTCYPNLTGAVTLFRDLIGKTL